MSINSFLSWLTRNYPPIVGRGRIVSFAMKRVAGFEIEKDIFGNLFLLDLDNYIDSRLFLEGSYEHAEIAELVSCIQEFECQIFIDVGANIGSYAIPISAHPLIQRVYAFEPDPKNYSQLLANIFLNDRCAKIIAYDFALSSEAGKSLLYLAREPRGFDSNKFNSGANSMIFNPERHKHSQSIDVASVKLDDVIQLENQCLAIKIDVEGHELDVLQGMEHCLINNNCVILIEVFPERRDVVDTYLNEHGYGQWNGSSLSTHNYIYLKDQLKK